MADVIRWYLVPMVDHVDPVRGRVPDPAMSAVNLSRCMATKITNDWALVRIGTDTAGHAELTKAGSKLVRMPGLKTTWLNAPVRVKTKLAGLDLSETDEIGVILDKVLARVSDVKRPDMRMRCVCNDGTVIDEKDMVEE